MSNLKSYKQLEASSKKTNRDFPVLRLAVLGDCSTQHLTKAIKGYAYDQGMFLETFDADYNQIDEQVIDETSELYAFQPNVVLIDMCSEMLYEKYCHTPPTEREGFAERMCQQIESHWKLVHARTNAKVLQFNFVEYDDRIFGNYASKVSASFISQLRKLNYLMMEGFQNHAYVFPVDVSSIQNVYGRKAFFDEKLYYLAKVAISLDVLPSVAKQVVDVLLALSGRFKKCAVLDLDNTLWGGVIGDDGISNIQIGELGLGHAFSDLQTWLKELKNRGVLLAVCSKNNEDIAKEPFEKHDEMVLRLDDISIFVANWENKASNIKNIQQTLNLGMDSFVFIDDNPFERNLVESMVPEVTVPSLPEDPSLYLSFLQELNLFETASHSKDDALRTKQYQDEGKRIALQKEFESFDEYLKSLKMIAVAEPFDPFYYPRIAQLSQRSNQFNLRTIRYTEADIERIAQDDQYYTLYFTLRDKFTDYGLISVVILENKVENELFINTWLMSCRVLKRGMEEFIINKMVGVAQKHGYTKITGEYIPTAKNAMVANIYEKLGFTPLDHHLFTVDTSRFLPNKTTIKEM